MARMNDNTEISLKPVLFDRHSRMFLAGIQTSGCPITTFGHDGTASQKLKSHFARSKVENF
jgi:hypothetical protein